MTDNAPAHGQPAPVTVAEVVERFLRQSKLTGRYEPKSLRRAEAILTAFVRLHGARSVSDCCPFHLSDFIEGHDGWKSNGTRRFVAATVHSVFNWAADQGHIARNPFKSVCYPKGERRPAMPDEQWERYCRLASKPVELVMRFLRLTGCRQCEARLARWKDFAFEQGVWVVPVHKSVRKTGKPKLKALTPETVALLRAIRADRHDLAGDDRAGILCRRVADRVRHGGARRS
jgi:integrase